MKLVEYFKSKERNRPIIEMATAIKDVSDNIVKLNTVLDKTFRDAELKENSKVKNVIMLAFNHFLNDVFEYASQVIIDNNIEVNKDLICDNIHKQVSTEYYKLFSILSAYEINEIGLASKLKTEWIDEITKQCISIIYNGQLSDTRIDQLKTKLKLDVEEYSIYLNNKVFNR